ncbi:acyltransferase family protein [Rheinheimera texasensis]|uniref:acyltransferase family protein n=1 Tax=Rheinheimera texasensis TaxID=306205 RepID=UPI0032B25EA4
MIYRPEVDGLRALAVLPVILFHAGFSAFSGGFVGVDVFFVISGYLITSIILNELSAGTFSLLHFWERRARRILPALYFVLLVSLPLAWFWLSPQDLLNYADSLLAVALFCSNIWFWLTSGYFDAAAEFKPLLHTWSLAVEEQFYLCFPLLMLLLWRWCKSWLPVLLTLALLVSLLLAEWGAQHRPAFTFYMLPTRAWELLAGALVAWWLHQNPRQFPAWGNQVGSLLGLLMLSGALVLIDKTTRFPGVNALLPVGGTVLILLFTTPQTLTGRLLSHSVLTSIGLVSYSAYLWHQPLFAFARHGSLDTPSISLMTGLSVLTLVLAWFSCKFIEAPFRQKQLFSRRQIFGVAGTGSLLFIVVAILGQQQLVVGRWQQQHPEFINIDPAVAAQPFRTCPNITLHGTASCKVFGQGSRRVVLWGDSHAGVLAANFPGLADTEFYVIAHGGCPPIVGVRRFDGEGNAGSCDKLEMLQSYADYIETLKPDLVILSARWTLYLQGWQRQGELLPAHHFVTTKPQGGEVLPVAARTLMLQQQLQHTISLFSQNAPVLLISQQPDYANTGFRPMERGEFYLPHSEMERWHQTEITMMQQLAVLPQTKVLDTKRLFCDTTRCQTRDKGTLLYFDTNHLSATGAARVWQQLRQEIVVMAKH